jgi:hypothetical protein
MTHAALLLAVRRIGVVAALCFTLGTSTSTAQATQNIVALNTKTLKFHCPQCEWAIRCTRNCVAVSLVEAKERGAVPCKVCHGRCR